MTNSSAETPSDNNLSAEVKTFLLKLARDNLVACVNGTAPVVPDNPPELTKDHCGCFVTITKHGRLRGCIGYIEGIKPLYEAIIDNVENAAIHDPRFSPVLVTELAEIRIEVSVLTKPEPLVYKNADDLLRQIVAGVDGIILTSGYHQSTYLPQVWEQLPDKVDFLEQLSLKGGMSQDGWKTASVKRYRATHFSEQ